MLCVYDLNLRPNDYIDNKENEKIINKLVSFISDVKAPRRALNYLTISTF